jgi:hypothetical protein
MKSFVSYKALFSASKTKITLGLFLISGLFVLILVHLNTIQISATPQVQAQVTVSAGTDLCAAGGEATDNILTAGETSFDSTDVEIIGCTFTIDGAHTFTSFTVGSGAILNHSATTTGAVNRLDITTTSAFSILSGGAINVNALGFPSGYTYDSGSPNVPTTTGAPSQIAGGAHFGGGGEGNGTEGPVYDSVFEPNQPGGGVGASYAGAGGGVVKITANSLYLDGSISANGRSNTSNAFTGSAGGSVWLVIASNITGSGTISAIGGAGGGNTAYGSGAGGSVAVEYGGTSTLLITAPSVRGGLQAVGNSNNRGAAGTVYFEDSSHTNEQGNLRVDNGGVVTSIVTPISESPLKNVIANNAAYLEFLPSSNVISSNLTIDNSAEVLGRSVNVTGSVTISNGGILSHRRTTTGTVYRLDLTADQVIVNTGAFINTNARGFLGGYTYNAGSPDVPTTTGAPSSLAGGSHFGEGGQGLGTESVVYDSIFEPSQPGGGVGASVAGAGGGAVKITSNSLQLDGSISANGRSDTSNAWTGSAGGSIWLVISGNITGSGNISATGGSGGGNVNYGAGAGGSVAIEYGGTSSIANTDISIQGGSQTVGNSTNTGAVGTIYFEDSTHVDQQGDLYFDNNSITTTQRTQIVAATFTNIALDNTAFVEFTSNSLVVSEDISINNSSILELATANVTGDVTISNSGMLSHSETTTGTVYRLDLTADQVIVNTGAFINTNARGFLGGYTYNAGSPNIPTTTGAPSSLAGGSHFGEGGQGVGTEGIVYDSIFEPNQPGGGVGGGVAGAGGGVVKITTNTLLLDGSISANGRSDTSNAYTGSAGGSIWLIVSGNITGSGAISAFGGSGGGNSNYGAGAGGSVAIEHGGTSSITNTDISVHGGSQGAGNSTNPGAVGTIYFEDSTHVNQQGDLYFDNNGVTTTQRTQVAATTLTDMALDNSAFVKLTSTTLTLFDDLTIDNNSILEARTIAATGDTSILNTSTLSHLPTTTSQVYKLDLSTANLTLSAGSQINVDGKGYLSGYTYNAGSPTVPTTTNASTSLAGGSHRGPAGQGLGVPSIVYDSIFEPNLPGAGSGPSDPASGGGVIKITASTLLLDGSITANGITSSLTGSAGGAIWLIVAGNITGTGNVSAIGGTASGNTNYGSGAGGSVAVEYGGTSTLVITNIVNRGGIQAAGGPEDRGAAGTIYFEGPGHANEQGDLRLDNGGIDTTKQTPLFITGETSPKIVQDLFVTNEALLSIDQPPCVTGLVFTVNGAQDFSGNGEFIDNSAGNCTTSYSALTISPTISAGIITIAYSENVISGGGYAPKTFECLDGLGGSPITCNAAAGLPTGLTMSSAGLISGTPSVAGSYNVIVRVTDSDPGGAVIVENTVNLAIGNLPSAPTLVSPSDAGDSGSLLPVLTATYTDADVGDTGFIEFRVSSNSAPDCLSNTNIIDSGSSAETTTNSENASYTMVTTLTEASTYYWCARAFDGALYDNGGSYTTMGSFLATSPAGSNQRYQAQQPESQPEDPVEEVPEEIPEEIIEEVIDEPEEPVDEELPVELSDFFATNLGVSNILSEPIQTPANLDQLLVTRVIIENVSGVDLNNVFFNLEIPNFISYQPGSLQYNGATQTDDDDADTGQANQASISNIVELMAADDIAVISFQLTFNEDELRSYIRQELGLSTAGLSIGELLAAVVDNPNINIQGTLSSSASEPILTNKVLIIPDISIIEAEETPIAIEEIPDDVEIPEDIDLPQPEPEPTPEEPAKQPQPEEQESASPQPEPESDLITLEISPAEDTENEQEELLITGSAESNDDTIEFSGTTSEPFAQIVVLINDGVAVTLTSDENGFWRTFVTSDALGINPGDSDSITVEAFAIGSDGNESNRLVQNIFVDRQQDGQILAEPITETEYIGAEFVETVQEAVVLVVEQVVVIVDENEEEIQTTLAVSAPVVVVTSAPLWGYAPYIPTLSYHFFLWIFGFARRKSKQGRLYGVAYDSITKEPMPLTIIRIFQSSRHSELAEESSSNVNSVKRKLMTTVVTDKQGRYEALLQPGDYEIEVKKPQYRFPSNLVETDIDGDYQHVSHGEFSLTDTTIGLPDLPLDPENASKRFALANVFKKAWLTLQKAGSHLAVPMLFIGAVGGVLVLFNDPTSPLNWILAILYVFMLVLQLNLREHIAKAWGIVYDVASGASLPLVTLQLIDPEFGKVVKSRLSDYEGRFAFLPEPGKYVIKANKEGYNQSEIIEGAGDLKPIHGEIQISKEGQQIDGDIAMSTGQ